MLTLLVSTYSQHSQGRYPYQQMKVERANRMLKGNLSCRGKLTLYLFEIMPKLRETREIQHLIIIINGKIKIANSKFPANRHLGFYDITTLPLLLESRGCFVWNNRATQRRNEIQDGGAR